MQEIDMKKLDLAIEYMKRMAEGNNPVTNRTAEKDSVINDVNVVRCLYFVSDILASVRKGECRFSASAKVSFPYEILKTFEYQQDNSISKVVDQMNSLVDTTKVKKISRSKIVNGLMQEGYLEIVYCQEVDKEIKVPTQKGLEIGIYTQRREGNYGKIYYTVMYNEQAQEFLRDNVERYCLSEETVSSIIE